VVRKDVGTKNPVFAIIIIMTIIILITIIIVIIIIIESNIIIIIRTFPAFFAVKNFYVK